MNKILITCTLLFMLACKKNTTENLPSIPVLRADSFQAILNDVRKCEFAPLIGQRVADSNYLKVYPLDSIVIVLDSVRIDSLKRYPWYGQRWMVYLTKEQKMALDSALIDYNPVDLGAFRRKGLCVGENTKMTNPLRDNVFRVSSDFYATTYNWDIGSWGFGYKVVLTYAQLQVYNMRPNVESPYWCQDTIKSTSPPVW